VDPESLHDAQLFHGDVVIHAEGRERLVFCIAIQTIHADGPKKARAAIAASAAFQAVAAEPMWVEDQLLHIPEACKLDYFGVIADDDGTAEQALEQVRRERLNGVLGSAPEPPSEEPATSAESFPSSLPDGPSVPAASSPPPTSALAEEMEEGRKQIAGTMREHLDNMKAESANEPGIALMTKQWNGLLADEVLSFVASEAFKMMRETGDDGVLRTQARAFTSVWVAITVFRVDDEENATGPFPGGYFRGLNGLVAESGFMRVDRDLAHWIYTVTKRRRFRTHLAFIPANSLAEQPVILCLPGDVLTAEDRRELGARRQRSVRGRS
jgi:hypothetical protein